MSYLSLRLDPEGIKINELQEFTKQCNSTAVKSGFHENNMAQLH